MLYLSRGTQGSRSPRAAMAVSDIRGHSASHGLKLHVAQRGLAVKEALNRLTRAPLGPWLRAAESFSWPKEVKRDLER